jgi:hypothetical protein
LALARLLTLKEAVAHCQAKGQKVTINQLRIEIVRGHLNAKNTNPANPRQGDILLQVQSLDEWLNKPRLRGRPNLKGHKEETVPMPQKSE